MTRKYSPPVVKLSDVLAALPSVEQPLLWVVGFRPLAGNSTRAHAIVELQYVRPNGHSIVWRRWGASTSPTSPTAPLSALLQAAQEAHWYCEGIHPAELLKRVRWDCDTL